jgi:hypothetical protein
LPDYGAGESLAPSIYNPCRVDSAVILDDAKLLGVFCCMVQVRKARIVAPFEQVAGDDRLGWLRR